MSKTGIIGMVGGKDIPIIHRFFIGYTTAPERRSKDQGAGELSGTFTDPAAGKEYALALINQKSDINFAVAGATGAGVIDAAKIHTFAIGVDFDQNYMAPGTILTSMVKRVDNEAFDMVKSVTDGTFKGGTVKYYGLKEGGVDAAMDEYNKGLIPDATSSRSQTCVRRSLPAKSWCPTISNLSRGPRRWERRRCPHRPCRQRQVDQQFVTVRAAFRDQPRESATLGNFAMLGVETEAVSLRNITKRFGGNIAVSDRLYQTSRSACAGRRERRRQSH